MSDAAILKPPVDGEPVSVAVDGAAATAPAAPKAAADPATYTVSVRSLCEFSARQGDLDRRFTPSATAVEGRAGQAVVAGRRGADYESEITLETRQGELRVRGRADGYDPRRRCLEEIKTIRGHPDEIPANRRWLHWAQLLTYGALFCRDRGLAELSLALVYFDTATQTEVEMHQLCSADELEAAFAERCAEFAGWAAQEAAHRRERDAALSSLVFPQPAFRTGQRELAAAVWRAGQRGRALLAQAPTGIGKTVGTLFPMLRAMPGAGIDKIAFLTCKGTGRAAAMSALDGLRSAAAGRSLRVLAIVAKDQACEYPDRACHGDSCPLARGFHDRLPAARAEAVGAGWLDAAAQRTIALRHGVCPYYLGQELLRWADVLVGDVHHAFDPNGQLWSLGQALDWRLAVLVDEAHNLVDRARRMLGAELRSAALLAAMRIAPAALRPAFGALMSALRKLAAAQSDDHAVLERTPAPLALAVQALSAAMADHFQRLPLATGALLNFHFELQGFVRRLETLGDHSLLEIERGAAVAVGGVGDGGDGGDVGDVGDVGDFGDGDGIGAGVGGEGKGDAAGDGAITLAIRNVVPAPFLKPRFAAWHTSVLFSATLAPARYQTDLLGLPDDTGWIDVPPAFPPGNLVVRTASRVSTRYADRTRTLSAVADLIARQFDEHPGNYLAFFGGFDYAHRVAARLAQRRPDIASWQQSRAMSPAARADFLARFDPGGQGIGFAVLGGVFAEGVDLPGNRLIGAFVATLGLPPISASQSHLRSRLDAMFGAGHGYADLVPAMQRVVQAAGRVLRTPDDRGWLWLLDDRYDDPAVAALLPPWWGLRPRGGS